ncbi:MAG TPA: DEAD/DEAH box helicase [Crocinitomix sp.]|nr:DEAD/DEAH box helicase [Crocinitomix sp.]
MNSFKTLGVHSLLVKRLDELGIVTPTEIQSQTIPYLLQKNNNLVAQAQTGTGKTAAFGLPLIEKVSAKNTKIQALILSPTRELVQQIAKQLFKFTKYYGNVYTVAVFGGPNMDKQLSLLNKPTQIIVATPGRLIDLLEHKKINIEEVKTIVLDEADEMLRRGFKTDIDHILTFTKHKSDIWLFSATMPNDIQRIIKKFMSKGYKEVVIDAKYQVNKNITHEFVVVEPNEKLNQIHQFLRQQKEDRGVIFCNTKAESEKLTKQLKARNYQVDVLNGDMNQKEREKVLRAFKSHNLKLLIATDVAARGIDIPNLKFVLHHQLPSQIEYYTHRAGRTARAGNKGLSIAFVSPQDKKHLKTIEKELNIKFDATVV